MAEIAESPQPVATDVRNARAALTSGIALAAVWVSLLGPVAVGPFELRPATPGYVLLLLLALPVALVAASRRLDTAWLFAGALALTGLPSLAVRSEGLGDRTLEVAAGALLTILLLGARAWRPGPGGPPDRPGPRAVLVAGAVALATIAFFQIQQRILLAAGVPNEDRSLIVGGVEVHHLSWGVPLVVGLGTWVRIRRGGGLRPVALLVLLGFGLGLVADEWLYYALADPTDEAYFAPMTPVSAVAAVLVVAALARLHLRRAPTRGTSP